MSIETHPLQKTFPSGDTSKLRSKDGWCRNCDRTWHGDGEKFRVCKGCKVALYCSEACQRAQWPSHKYVLLLRRRLDQNVDAVSRPLCKLQREEQEWRANCPELEARILDMPSIVEMQAFMRDFTEVHRHSFENICQAKLTINGGVQAFLSSRTPQLCVVLLDYRHWRPLEPDELVNPALTFAFTNMVFLPLERVLNEPKKVRLREAWEASAIIRDRMRAQGAHDPNFVDVIPVVFSMLEIHQLSHLPCFRPPDNTTLADNKFPLEQHRQFVELGVVMRPPRVGESPVPGCLKPKRMGKKWEWKPLFKDWLTDREWRNTRCLQERAELLKRKISEVQRG